MNIRGMISISSYVHMIIVVEIEGEVANDIWCQGNPNLYAVFWYCEVHYSMNVRGKMSISSYMHMIIVVEIEGEDEHSKVLVLFKCAS